MTAEDKEVHKLADSLGIELDTDQLNIGGERALLSPHKLVLTGRQTKNGKRVVLKCAKHPDGVGEIISEHNLQQSLKGLAFAEQELIMPHEIFFGEKNGYTVSVTEYIDQEKVFTDYPLETQFFMALQAFEAQESFHATTREHHQAIRQQFIHHSSDFYIDSLKNMSETIAAEAPTYKKTLAHALDFLKSNRETLDFFDRYLIHFDFVPHNVRIADRQLYLLDFVSFRLGNKYEGWARFINFMEIHNPKLVPLLLDYVARDRGEKDILDVRLMRAYKIVFLLYYYAKNLPQTTGNLRELTQIRLELWHKILQAVLEDRPIESAIISTYHQQRDSLRTPEEKARQRQFTWVSEN